MTRNRLRGPFVLAFLVATAALEMGAGRAHAQWGFGWFNGFNYVPQPTDYINQLSLVNAANATRGRVPNNVYANNPNSYVNRVRDNGFVPHYAIESRRSPGEQPARRSSSNVSRTSAPQPRPSTPAPAAPAVAEPAPPLASFFDATRKLIWPSDAPVDGDLGEKRNVSDQASLAVRDLVEKHGSAPITTVTDARQKLLDYGRPALRHVRSYATSRVADTFNVFLLSLYDSLAQAANPPAGS